MATIPSTRPPKIQIVNGEIITTSLAVADHFGKRHDDVLRKIQNIDCSPEFNARNFAAVKYHDGKGEERPAYNITRDGFTFLAMGFTGKRASEFKEAYINAFNQMEKRLSGDLHQVENLKLQELRFNTIALIATLQQIKNINIDSLYPMLLAAQSPLAAQISNLITDSVFLARKINEEISK